MGVEQSTTRRREGLHPALASALFERALLDTLRDMSVEGLGESEMIEHAWDPKDCSPRFRVLGDRLTARRAASITTDCIRGKKGYRAGRHVWEIQWETEERGTSAVVGVATPKAPLAALGFGVLVGRNSESWGWDLVTKKIWHEGERGSYPAFISNFVVPDTIFVILDMDEGTMSFSTRDLHLGIAFKGLPRNQQDRPMCPIVSAVYGNCDIRMRYMGRGESVISNLRQPISSSRSEYPIRQPPETEASRRRSTRSPPDVTPHERVAASTDYKFDHTHGTNIAVMCGGKKSKRLDPVTVFNNGVVLTSQPLKVNELFEVRVDSKVARWIGGMDIGATTNSSGKLNFPRVMVDCREGTTFMWTSNKIAHNGKEMAEVRENMDELSIGDRVGVMRKPDNTLHFFLNGKNIGRSVKTIPDVLYGVVDVYGQVEQVTITGGTAETQTSNQETTVDGGDVSVLVRMNNVINLLKLSEGPDLPVIINKLSKDVLEPYQDTQDRSLRQKYGDHLAEIGAAAHLSKLLLRLEDRGMETAEGWVGMKIVRSIFWNYSDASMKMAKAIGRSGLLGRLVNELKYYGPAQSKNEKKKDIVSAAINILHNCAKATENRQIFKDISAVQHLAPFLKSEDMEIVISSLLTLSYITEDDQKGLLEADTKTISILLGMLRNALDSPNLRGSSGGCTWSSLEIVVGIGNIAVNGKNRENMIERDVIPLLVTLMNKGGFMEIECAANALWAFVKTESDKRKIRDAPDAMTTLNRLSKSSNQGVQQAAQRVILAIKPAPMTQGGQMGEPRKTCNYKDACKRFMATLKIDDSFFLACYDKCYCTECHASRREKLYYTQGTPAKDYALPVGWARFSLKAPASAAALDAGKQWHVAYHGTQPDKIKAILEADGLLIPGDVALGGNTLSEAVGHFNKDWKPEEFDTRQIFVSPSIRYSGMDVYSKVKDFQDQHTNKSYKAKVAFQLWIRPESYIVGKQTIGATEEIDPKFSNQEIEWSTKERGSVKLYGLLVRLDESKG